MSNLSLRQALKLCVENVKYSINWGKLYSKMCEVMGNDFDSRTPYYEWVDELMEELGFRYNESNNSYIRKDYKPETKRQVKGQERFNI